MRPLIVGDIVKSTCEILDNPEGTEGIVYEEYYIDKDRGVSVIFQNGEYAGFSSTEQSLYLKRVGHEHELSGYEFENVMKVSRDFEKGVFRVVSG